MATSTSYWCYRCDRFIRIWPSDSSSSLACPNCDSGFLEQIDSPPSPPPPPLPSAARRSRRRNRGSGDRSPFNPVIVLRGAPYADQSAAAAAAAAAATNFELFYDDGAGSGLRPVPASMSELLMGSGFERLLDQIMQIEISGVGRGRSCDRSPAAKSAVESMPTIPITEGHVSEDDDAAQSHCAVCKEAFEIGSEAREMPCKHIYHQDCILPWLSLKNSCPVCRYEMPADALAVDGGDEAAVGLTIWRLPGGGFAVGRFTGEREAAGVYTEVDGGFGSDSNPRRAARSERAVARRSRNGGGGGGGIGRAVRNFLVSIWRRRSSSPSSGSSTARSLTSIPSGGLRVETRAAY